MDGSQIVQEHSNQEEPSNIRGTTIMQRKVEVVQTTCKTKTKHKEN